MNTNLKTILTILAINLLFWPKFGVSDGLETPKPDNLASQMATGECFAQKDFSLNLFLNGSPVAVSKNSCEAKVVLFRGQGKRWSVNLCDREIYFTYLSPLDSTTPQTVRSGSTHCPNPLFGIDIPNAPNNFELFQSTKTEVTQILKDIRINSGKSDSINTVHGQLLCLEKVIGQYLEECIPFSEANNSKTEQKN